KELGYEPGKGRQKMFEVREIESDISFIRNYLTKELVFNEDLYLFEKKGRDYRITEKDHKEIREELVSSRVNGGFPYIVVENGDHRRNGELYLRHNYEGTELDIKYLEHVLPYVFQLWGSNVHIETTIDGKKTAYSYDGKAVRKQIL